MLQTLEPRGTPTQLLVSYLLHQSLSPLSFSHHSGSGSGLKALHIAGVQCTVSQTDLQDNLKDLVPEDHLRRNSRSDYGGNGRAKRGKKGKLVPAGLNRKTVDRLWTHQSKQAEECRTPVGQPGKGWKKQTVTGGW